MIKLVLRTILLLLFSAMAAVASFGQQLNPDIQISGNVVDSLSRRKLDFITVSVFDEHGSKLGSVYTDVQGHYNLTVKAVVRYRVVCSFVGYQNKTCIIDRGAAISTLSAGEIAMVPAVNNLEEVKVMVARKVLVQRPGMLVYNVGNDPSNKGGTATDVLRKTPVLSVDARGNVSMRGSGNIKILVDGKYSGQIARSPADALNMMPADAIQSVEIITTPSAKYDAEGAAGIINIITKKGGRKMNGAVELVGGNWEQAINPRIAMSRGKWNVNANAHLHRLRSKSFEKRERQNLEGTSEGTSLDQQVSKENIAPHGSVSMNVDYLADSLNVFSFGATSWFGKWPDDSRGESELRSSSGNVISRYYQLIDARASYLGADFNVGYTHKFRKIGQELVLLAQVSPSKDKSMYLSDQLSDSESLLYRESNNSVTHNTEWTFQADYLQPLGKKNRYTLELGVKSIRRKVNNDYVLQNSDSVSPETLIPVPSRSDLFSYKQEVSSAYFIAKANLPSQWYLELGGRFERTVLNASFAGNGDAFSQNFNNVVPTATLSKRINPEQMLSISYTKRLTRPYIWDLNPNANTSDPQNIITGNPNLDAEQAHQAEVSYSFSANSGIHISPAIYWKQTDNSIEDYTSLNAQGVSVSSKQNLAANRQFGLNVSTSIPLNSKFRINTNVNINRLDFRSSALNIAREGWAVEANLNGTYSLQGHMTLQAYGSYNGREVTLQGYRTGNYYYSFSARKEFPVHKISVTLAAVNPFTRYVSRTSFSKGAGFEARNMNSEYNRGFRLSVGWEFGSLFKQSESVKIKNDDIKGQNKG